MADHHKAKQIKHLFRWCAELVVHRAFYAINLFDVGDARQGFVIDVAHANIGHIGVGMRALMRKLISGSMSG